MTFALITVAIAWPLQSALHKRIPVLLALVVTDRCDSRRPCDPGFFGGLGHGVSITNLVADSYNPGWIIGATREVGGRSYGLVSFIVIAFAFIVLGLLEVDIASGSLAEHDCGWR